MATPEDDDHIRAVQHKIAEGLGIPLEALLAGVRQFGIPESGIRQENSMQRVLRWDVPVDDQWHEIGAGAVVHVAARGYRERPGDLVEVWTLEEADKVDRPRVDSSDIPKRSVSVFGTGHSLPDGVYHVGTAVVPTFHVVSGPTRGTVDGIESRAGLVWHIFAKHDTQTDPRPLGAPVADGRTRDAAVRTLDDEATSLAYWLANELGEHVDDQDGETLTETVQRLVAHRLADAHQRRTSGAPHIGGFQRGHIVTIGANGDQHEGQTGVVATLDHDHGWRLWVRVGRDVHDQHAPALYLSPDDIDMVVVP